MGTKTEKIQLIEHLNQAHADALNRIGRYFDAVDSTTKNACYQLTGFDEQLCYLVKRVAGKAISSLTVEFNRTGDAEARILYLSYAAKHQQGQFPLIRNIRRFRYVSKQWVSPHMCRLYWSACEPLGGFPPGYAFYVSLQPNGMTQAETALNAKQMAFSRYYTLRRVHAARGDQPAHIEMDIYVHGVSLGSQWIDALQPNDLMITIGEYDEQLDRINGQYPYVLMGDETAYPAIAAFLERQSEQQRRQALLLLFAHDADELQYFDDVAGFTAIKQQLILYSQTDLQPVKIAIEQHLQPHMTQATIWGALEAGRAQALNQWISQSTAILPHQVRLKGYWRAK